MKKAICLSLICCVLGGCSHQLELTNIRQYECTNIDYDFEQRGLHVNIVNSAYGESERAFCQQIADQLARQGGYLVRISPEEDDKSDVNLSLSVGITGTGDGSNFFVSWPGFIIFTHAWLGYGYTVSYRINCEAKATVTGAQIGSLSETYRLTMRYADFDQTWAAGCGWILFYSGSALINGFFVTKYDTDITPLLQREAIPRLAAPISNKIVKMINHVNWETDDGVTY